MDEQGRPDDYDRLFTPKGGSTGLAAIRFEPAGLRRAVAAIY
jgi:hypothetical protein